MKVLYIDIDTLRPDHLGCYGYHRNTSPHIDRIASEGVILENCYASDAPCLPSRAALMTGQFGIHNGAINHSGTNADLRNEGASRGFNDRLERDSFPGFMNSRLGLHTCYIGGFGARHSLWTYYGGFREIHDTGKGGLESAEEVTPTVLEWLESNRNREDWFLHVNYWDPHTPYRAPAEFGNPFKDEPLPSWLNQEVIDRHMKVPGPHTIQDINMYDDRTFPQYPRQPGHVTNMDEMRDLIDGYDCGISYVDSHIGKLLEKFEEQGILDELIILVSSDHGENFGELGMYAEHGTADYICNRVPMIIRWPGKALKSSTHKGLQYNIDLLPTLADLTGKERAASWEGESYATAVEQGENKGREELILGQCAHGCQRSVRWDKWIYIRSWHDGYHCFDEEMLFDLEKDPQEQINLIDKYPEVARIAREKYDMWHKEMMESMPYGYTEDPMETVLREIPCHCHYDMKKYSKRLTDTGRGDSVPVIKERHPEMFMGK